MRSFQPPLRRGLGTAALLAAVWLTTAATAPPAAAPTAPPAAASAAAVAPLFRPGGLDTIIQPVSARYVADAVARADAEHAAALVLEIDTPGGLLSSTREITRALLAARTPVVAWVAPQGAQAASAGFFSMAADIAAALGTNTGAAHPVGGEGEDIGGTLGKKVEQDAAAQIRSLAARHGRNVELAQAAVIESRSFTAQEAQQGHLVEVVAPSLPALLRAVDGRRVPRPEGPPVLVATADAAVERVEMGRFQRFLALLVHPNVAYILMALGMLGLYFELSTPGAVLPGVVGATSLLLGLYALSVLPVSAAGVALLALAALFFLAEIKVTSHGLLTVAGVLCLALGSLMLIDSPDPAMRISRGLIVGVSASLLAVLF